jgi:hypothetical protein
MFGVGRRYVHTSGGIFCGGGDNILEGKEEYGRNSVVVAAKCSYANVGFKVPKFDTQVVG